jgi:hypothetical protein
MAETMEKVEIDRIVAELREPRRCRVCGLWFRPERWTALLCSTTCQQRSHRGGDLAYLADLDPAIRDFDRRRHENVKALINQLREHNRAVEARRHETDTAEILGRFWLSYAEDTVRIRLAFLWAQQQTREPPEATPEIVLEAINEIMPSYPAEAAAQIQAIILDRLRKRRERLTTEAAGRVIGRIAQAAREGRALSTVMVGVSTIADPVAPGGGAPKTAPTPTIITDPTVPFRSLSPEAAAVLEKIFQAWRIEVVEALSDLLKQDGQVRSPEETVLAIQQLHSYIPIEAIRQILKEP